ncbi:guanylate kinase [Faecalimonas umbilicata]|uniref:Guanylate kinase n=1 Tax=Faecalimonas umbilicata TaxID=1912855 RepID=A0A4R3J6P1_9FIRM|nr:guanylate kinase [Faecalimonas umbilicata]TCS61014.1 guanylate kinase [Faecalimonas umbilicata]GBU06141.1 hypothetical protein FAEUMB_26820 [Faecalimonas umbilicata]
MSLKRITIGIDFDDVLSDLNSRAIEMANEKQGLSLMLNDITSWENTGKASIIKKYYKTKALYKRQFVTNKTKELFRKICKEGEVFIVTAIAPEFMGLRHQQIKEAFPDFPDENIIMGKQKHLIKFDIILDDCPDNVFRSTSSFPVLMRRPWNTDVTGILSVNDLEDFLQLIHQIKNSVAGISHAASEPSVIALIGPSGSGKTEWMNRLLKESNIAHPISYTTNPNNNIIHRYMSLEEFEKANFFEKTMYGGYGYGTKEEDIMDLIQLGYRVVMPMDICGAVTMKRKLEQHQIFDLIPRRKTTCDISLNDFTL